MADISINDIPNYTAKDFKSDQTVRWCPGCGDYAILAAVQKAMPNVGKRKEDIVFISGIGCSSRFPYYMDTYGIHSIHGRAPTLATGLKVANPNIEVFVVTGDGDGLSIGGNHLLHACRRNIDLNILLFNNRIYGLTKGQYSPTSEHGKKTKSSPVGSIDYPLNPVAVALAAEATFVARSLDRDTQHLDGIIAEAAEHHGVSFTEILQNCNIFNDGAWEYVADRSSRPEHALILEHGKPMIFGTNNDKGIRMNGARPEVVQLGDQYSEDDLIVHDETNANLAHMLAYMDYPDFPVPMGVIYRTQRPTYEDQLMAQIEMAQAQKSADLKSLYHADYTWTVAEDGSEVSHADADMVEALDEEYVATMERVLEGDVGTSDLHEGLETDTLAQFARSDRKPIVVSPDTSLADTIALMREKNIGAMLVVDGSNRPIGIFTESDVLRKVATQVKDLKAHRVADFMTRNPDVLHTNIAIAHALHLMSIHRYRHVPLVDNAGVAVGVISFRDVVHYIERYFDKEK